MNPEICSFKETRTRTKHVNHVHVYPNKSKTRWTWSASCWRFKQRLSPTPRPPPRSPLWSVLASEKGEALWYYTKAVVRSSCPILEILRISTIISILRSVSNYVNYIQISSNCIHRDLDPTHTKLLEIWKSNPQRPSPAVIQPSTKLWLPTSLNL